jgi:hypothetical protein
VMLIVLAIGADLTPQEARAVRLATHLPGQFLGEQNDGSRD